MNRGKRGGLSGSLPCEHALRVRRMEAEQKEEGPRRLRGDVFMQRKHNGQGEGFLQGLNQVVVQLENCSCDNGQHCGQTYVFLV